MRITVVGTGYVGLVGAAGLAEVGHRVIGMDVDADRIERLVAGEVPIYEPGLEPMIARNAAAGRLTFTTDLAAAMDGCEVVFIAVGTPPGEDGSADISHVLAAARDIGRGLRHELLVVVKSTVPVGTCDRVRAVIMAELEERGMSFGVRVASNPEFLKEGAAIADFMKPDRIIAGVDDEADRMVMRELYAPFNRNHEKLMFMDVRSSELTKYAANTMLATRISLMNEFANIAERVGADIEKVRVGIGSDPRIGYSFIYPGAGYGGSCFPKDVRALAATATQHGYEGALIRAVEAVNERQKTLLFRILERHFDGHLAGRRIAVWGLAFKPNTDDMREAPSRVLIEALLEAGAEVAAHDPVALAAAGELYAGQANLELVDDPYEAARDTDALALVTEWKPYWAPDFTLLLERMRQPVLVDGRNIWEPDVVHARGFDYYGIGRPERVRRQAPAEATRSVGSAR